MRLLSNWLPIFVLGLIFTLFSSCSLDPNVRKQKYFENGQSFFEKKQYKESAIEFGKAIKIDPNYADAHFQLAESYLYLQESDRAYQEFTRTVELRPQNYRARSELANLLIQSGKFQEAQEQTAALLKMRPDDPGVHALVSSLLAAQDKIPDAISEMQRAIALAPGRWELYLSIALLQFKNMDLLGAETNLKKVIELNPKAMQARLTLGTFYQSQKRFDEAERQFRDAMTLDQNSIDPRKALASLYLAQGRKTDAENTLKQAKIDLRHNPDSFLALSNFYFITGDMGKAVDEYAALYHERPKDADIKKKYIQLLLQTHRYDEARRLNDEILKTNPNDDDALVYRSEMQISNGAVNDAAVTLQTVVKNAPNNSQAHYVFGVALGMQGNSERAESEWREALRLNPNLLDAQRSIANAAMRQGQMDVLRDAANQMIRLQPGAPEGYALRALASINQKQYSNADADVQRAIEVAPQSAYGYVQLGNLKFAEKQYDEAVKAFQDALIRNANSTDALRGLLSAYIAKKQIDQAIAAANVQIGKSPTNSSFYFLLGDVLFHNKGDLAGAAAAFEKSVALDKHNSNAMISLCQVRTARGETDQAIATGELALKENPRQPALYILMGKLYEGKSDWKKAGDAYQSALAINPQDYVAANYLARVIVQSGGNLDTALSLAQTSVKGLPDSPLAFDTLGWIYYEKGLFGPAVSNLKQALKLQEENKMPENPDIRYHLGLAYEKTEQPELARQHFEYVLKTFPNYHNAAKIKDQLIHLKS